MRRKLLAGFERGAYRHCVLEREKTLYPAMRCDWVEGLQHCSNSFVESEWIPTLVGWAANCGAVNITLFLMEIAMAHRRKYKMRNMPIPSDILWQGAACGKTQIVQLAVKLGARNFVRGIIEAAHNGHHSLMKLLRLYAIAQLAAEQSKIAEITLSHPSVIAQSSDFRGTFALAAFRNDTYALKQLKKLLGRSKNQEELFSASLNIAIKHSSKKAARLLKRWLKTIEEQNKKEKALFESISIMNTARSLENLNYS